MARRRTVGSLVRADLGKWVSFETTRGNRESGTLRSFSHGIYNTNIHKDGLPERDVELVMITLAPPAVQQIVAPFGAYTFWCSPDTALTAYATRDTEARVSDRG